MKPLISTAIASAFFLASQFSHGACMRTHNYKIHVDIDSCTPVTFHSDWHLVNGTQNNIEDFKGALLGVRAHAIELIPFPYPVDAVEPTWLKEHFPLGVQVAVFIEGSADSICPNIWKTRKDRVIIPIARCCDTRPARGMCLVPQATLPVSLEPKSEELHGN